MSEINKIKIFDKVNMNHGIDVKYTSEYLFRLQKIVEAYKKTLESYIDDLKDKRVKSIPYLRKKLTNHINNKIRVDGGSNLFLQLPDKSKWYGDIEEYQHFSDDDGKRELISKILDEFENVLSGDWEEYGKPFLYDDAGSAKMEQENPKNEPDVIKYLSVNCNTIPIELQRGLVFFHDNKLDPEQFVNVLKHIYKFDGDVQVKFSFPTVKEILFTIDDGSRVVSRAFNNVRLILKDFTSNTAISFNEYKSIHEHETKYFKRISNNQLVKKEISTQIAYVYPFILLDYQFIDKTDTETMLGEFFIWMSNEIGVELNPDYYTSLQTCALIKYHDDEKDSDYFYFTDFIKTILDQQRMINMEYYIDGKN